MSNRKFLIIFILFAVVFGLLMAVSVSADPVSVNKTGSVSTSQTTSTRMYRDGDPSDCSGKTYPGTLGSGPFGYTVEGTFGPVASDGCITVTWDPQTCDVNVFVAAFKGGFDPAWGPADSANYLGDAGNSIPGTFSFPVSKGDTFVLVFMNSFAVEGCSYSYSFTYDGAPPKGLGCTLSIPDGSVVGNTPYRAQVFYAPGKVSPGIFLNPGTYIVTGQDSSQTYYQIMLACQFLWVRKDNMQPSFESPQDGAALPTRIIDSPNDGSTPPTGPANDL